MFWTIVIIAIIAICLITTRNNFDRLRRAIQQQGSSIGIQMEKRAECLNDALNLNDAYENEISNTEETAVNTAPQEVRDKMNVFRMNDEFREEASALLFPQFMMEIGASLFSDNEYVLLDLEHLSKGFTLKDKDVQIDFNTLDAEMARVDVDDSKEATPNAWRLVGADSAFFKEWFNEQPSNIRMAHCSD